MLFGYLFSKKKYNGMQIVSPTIARVWFTLNWDSKLSIVIVTVGVVLATLSKPSSTSKNAVASPPRSPEQLRAYTIGIIMLVVSLFSTGLLGLLQEKTYQKYGPHWREGVFYTVSTSILESRNPLTILALNSMRCHYQCSYSCGLISLKDWQASLALLRALHQYLRTRFLLPT